jgi:hypothetical protein
MAHTVIHLEGAMADADRKRAGSILMVFGTPIALFGVLGLAVEFSENRETGGIIFAIVLLLAGAALFAGGLKLRRSGATGKSVGELTPADFPGLDPVKFNAWKTAQAETARTVQKAIRLGFLILIPISIISILFSGPLIAVIFLVGFAGWIVYMLVYVRGLARPLRELEKSLGITKDLVKRAIAGRPAV